MFESTEYRDPLADRLLNAFFLSHLPVSPKDLNEEFDVSMISSFLAPRYLGDNRLLLFAHELPIPLQSSGAIGRSRSDLVAILATVDGPHIRSYLPVAVFEFSVKDDDKRDQAFKYAANLSHWWPSDRLLEMLSFCIHIDQKNAKRRISKFVMDGFVGWGRDKIGVIPMRDVRNTGCKHLRWAFDCVSAFAASLPVRQSNCNTEYVPFVKRNTFVDEDRVFKVFNYIGRNVGMSQRRSIDLNLRYLPQEVDMVHSEDSMEIISYPKIKGNHILTNWNQLLAVVEHVERLHGDDIVHGDIRLSNIVFAEDISKSQLIDFDYSGKGNEKFYPDGFNHKIDDGQRHDTAMGGSLLLYEHDLHSLGYILSLYGYPFEDLPSIAEMKDWVRSRDRSAVPSMCVVIHRLQGTNSPPRDEKKAKRSASVLESVRETEGD